MIMTPAIKRIALFAAKMAAGESFTVGQIVDEVQGYAREVAEATLHKAAENAKVYRTGVANQVKGQWIEEVLVDRDSITETEIITP